MSEFRDAIIDECLYVIGGLDGGEPERDRLLEDVMRAVKAFKEDANYRTEFIRGLQWFSGINNARGVRFHLDGIEEWSALEWAGAMCGEAGECANACKKLRRMELSPQGSRNNFESVMAARKVIAQEAAGTFIYLALLCRRLHINFPLAIIEEFNRVSEREGYPERL